MNPVPLTLSQLTSANVCPVSPVLSVRMENVTSDAAALGSAVHEALETGGALAAARKYDVPLDDVLPHVEAARDISIPDGYDVFHERKLELRVPNCGPFVGRDGVVSAGVPGTADRIGVRGEHAYVDDYKTGSPPHHDSDRPIERWAQGMGYALAVMDAFPFVEAVTLRRIWTKTGMVEEFVIDDSNYTSIRAWIFNIVTRVCEEWKKLLANEKNDYRVTLTWDGCLGCDALSICAAYQQRTERAAALLAAFPKSFSIDSDNDVRSAWTTIEMGAAWSRGAKEMKELVGAYLVRNGPVEMSESTELRMYDHHSGSQYPRVLKKEG